jgi:hypothetical protein
MMSSDFSGLRRRLNFQPNRINDLAKSWKAALARPCEFPTQSDQWFSGNLAAPRMWGPAICAPLIRGAHRLIPPTRGFRRPRRKPSTNPIESRTQNCVVLNQRLNGDAPRGGAQLLRRAARQVSCLLLEAPPRLTPTAKLFRMSMQRVCRAQQLLPSMQKLAYFVLLDVKR